MFTKISMGGTGMIVFIIMSALGYFNIISDENQVVAFVEAGVTFGGFLMWTWGQFRRSDLTGGLVRKSDNESQ